MRMDMTPTRDAGMGRPGNRELLWIVLAIQVAVLAVVSLSPNASVPFDMTVYAEVADRIFGGAWPYRDVALEYPPLSLVAILLPRLLETASPVGGYEGYQAVFLLLMGATSLIITVILWMLARGWSPAALDPVRPLLYALLLVALASPVMLWRFDLLPAMLTAIAFYLTVSGRALLGGVALALAIVAKLYPAALVPIVIAAYLATRDRSGLGKHLTGLLGTGLVLGLGTLVLAPEAIGSVLGYHLERGIQLESSFAGIMELGHLLGFASATVSDQFNSLQVDSALSGIVLPVQPFVLIGLLVVVWWAAWRTFRREAAEPAGLSLETLVSFMVAALLAFMLGSRVFSPQFMIWILPFAPFLPRAIFATVAVAFAITFLLFPFLYNGLIGLELLPVVLLNVRNLLLLGVLVVIVAGAAAPRSDGARAAVPASA